MAINLFWAINHLLFNPILPYRLYSKKDRSKSDIVRGNGFRLSKLKLQEEKDLDSSRAPTNHQEVGGCDDRVRNRTGQAPRGRGRKLRQDRRAGGRYQGEAEGL